MRYVLIALSAAAITAPAFAFTPQPSGRPAPNAIPTAAVDPCRGMTGNSHIRCVQRHFKLPPAHRIGAPSGGGAGK